MNIAILGTGNLGQAIIKGLLNKSFANTITASRRNIESIQFLANQGVKITANNIEAIQDAQIIILGVKPYLIKEVITEIKPFLTENQQIISLAAGLSLTEIKEMLPPNIALHRVMPNTAAAVNESISFIASHSGNSIDNQAITTIFKHVGETIEIQEAQMDAAMAIGSCGIAFAMRFIRAMAEGGVQTGIDAKSAHFIVSQMTKGAASLLLESNNHPEVEIDKVTTPNGFTIKGLNKMEGNGFSAAVIQGVVAACKK